MTPKIKQARIRLHQLRIARGLKVAQLASFVGHDISVVSKAINHGRYPRVLTKIKEALRG